MVQQDSSIGITINHIIIYNAVSEIFHVVSYGAALSPLKKLVDRLDFKMSARDFRSHHFAHLQKLRSPVSAFMIFQTLLF